MKSFLFFLSFIPMFVFAQVNYSYDKSGNRTTAKLVIENIPNNSKDTTEFSTTKKGLTPSLKSTVYPNPTNEIVNIQVSDISTLIKVQVLDAVGKEIYSTQINTTGTINLKSYEPGIYYIFLDAEGKQSRWKIIKF